MAVVAVAGGTTAAVLVMSNSGDSLEVDIPKTADELVVGDYVKGDVDGTATFDYSSANGSKITFSIFQDKISPPKICPNS